MSNDDLLLLATFVDQLIICNLKDEIWYATDDKFTPTYKILWEPHKNVDQLMMVVNKLKTYELVNRYLILSSLDLYIKTADYTNAIDVCIHIVKMINQIRQC